MALVHHNRVVVGISERTPVSSKPGIELVLAALKQNHELLCTQDPRSRQVVMVMAQIAALLYAKYVLTLRRASVVVMLLCICWTVMLLCVNLMCALYDSHTPLSAGVTTQQLWTCCMRDATSSDCTRNHTLCRTTMSWTWYKHMLTVQTDVAWCTFMKHFEPTKHTLK